MLIHPPRKGLSDNIRSMYLANLCWFRRATSSETPRRIVESNGNTPLTPTTSKEPLGPPPRSQSSLHSSLPARPDLITPDILRQQALASQAPRRAAAMEPPAAPSRRDTELTSPKVSKRDLPSSAAPTSSSRQSSPRRSETLREREHTSRDGRSRGSGDRAVESNDRSSRHKDSSREDKERPRESSSRSSRDDDRRSDRDSNHASRSRDDYRSKDARRSKEDEKRDERRDADSSSSRRREDGKVEAHRDRNPSDGRSDKESSNRDSRSRDTSVREPSTRDSGSSRGGSRPGQDNVVSLEVWHRSCMCLFLSSSPLLQSKLEIYLLGLLCLPIAHSLRRDLAVLVNPRRIRLQRLQLKLLHRRVYLIDLQVPIGCGLHPRILLARALYHLSNLLRNSISVGLEVAC